MSKISDDIDYTTKLKHLNGLAQNKPKNVLNRLKKSIWAEPNEVTKDAVRQIIVELEKMAGVEEKSIQEIMKAVVEHSITLLDSKKTQVEKSKALDKMAKLGDQSFSMAPLDPLWYRAL